MIEKAVKDTGKIEPRKVRATNPFPDRGVGVNKAGGVRLAISVIAQRTGRQEGPPAVDSILLTKDEWAGFAPPEGKDEWTLPESTARRFAPALSPITDSILVPRPADLTKAELMAKVVRKHDGQTVIRLTGTWESKHFRDGNKNFPITTSTTGEGIAVYDPTEKRVTSLVWVLKGTYRMGPKGAAVPTAAVVEWVEAIEE